MVKQPLPAWRAPVSSTVTKGAPLSPAASTASSSARNLLELGGQQPHHLPLGDHQAHAGQQRHDPFAGHLALKMEHQHQTMKMRAAAADDPCIERRDQPLPVRCLPALAPIARRLGLQHQVLNDDLLEPAWLSFSFSPRKTRHFANQLANQVDQLGRRLPFKRIAGAEDLSPA